MKEDLPKSVKPHKDQGARKPHRLSLKRGFLVAVGVSAITLVVLLFLTMDRNAFKKLGNIGIGFALIALLLTTAKWAFTCIRSHIIIKAVGAELGTREIVKAVLSGAFAGAITPFHAAGIPTEIYFLYQSGLSAGEASAVVSIGAAMSILLFLLAMPFVLVLSATKIDIGFGYRSLIVAAAIIAAVFFLLVVYSMRRPKEMASRVIRSAPRFLRVRESFSRQVDRFFTEINNFSRALRSFVKAPLRLIIPTVILTMLFWFCSFLIAPVIIIGLGYPHLFWEALLAQLVISVLLPFIPIPGESGFAEMGFASIYALFLPANLIGLTTLLWRFFSFYIVIFVTGLVFLWALRDVEHGQPGKVRQLPQAIEDVMEVNPGSKDRS